MMADFIIKRNDTYPPLEAQLKSNNVPIDLTEAKAIHIWLKSASLLIKTGACQVVNAPEGKVKYEWQDASESSPADTHVAGTYAMEFEIIWKDNKVQSVPNEKAKNLTLQIDEDLGPEE